MDARDHRVAIVMITHNRVEEVLRSLDRLVRLPERPRIVVVDNGSSDGTTKAIVERVPSVEIIRLEENVGAAGRNIGLNLVDAPFVAFCDDDIWWEPGSLRRAADLLEAHPRLAILTGRILEGPEQQEAEICLQLENSPLPAVPGLPGYPLLGFLAGASVVRRSAILEAGGFDPRFFIGGEEELLAADLVSRGWHLRYIPEIIVHHYASSKRDVHGRNWHVVRNALWVAWLRRPWPSALRRTLSLARPFLRDRAVRKGLVAALTGLGWVSRERRVIQPDVERMYGLLEASSKRSAPANTRSAIGHVAHVLQYRYQGRRPASQDGLPDL